MSSLADREKQFLLRDSQARPDCSPSSMANPSKFSPDEPAPSRLGEPGGAFVTLRRGSGCEAALASSLRISLWSMWWLIAPEPPLSNDPRFDPVAPQELSEIDIEISILSFPEDVTLDEIEPGRHGLIVSQGRAARLLLPQVASEYGGGAAFSGRDLRERRVGTRRVETSSPREFKRLPRKCSVNPAFGENEGTAHSSPRTSELFQFDVISGVDFAVAEGDQNRRGIRAGPQHDAFAQNLARNIGPIPFLRNDAEAVGGTQVSVHIEGVSRRLVGTLMLRAGIAENAEIVAHLHALRVTQDSHRRNRSCPLADIEFLPVITIAIALPLTARSGRNSRWLQRRLGTLA